MLHGRSSNVTNMGKVVNMINYLLAAGVIVIGWVLIKKLVKFGFWVLIIGGLLFLGSVLGIIPGF